MGLHVHTSAAVLALEQYLKDKLPGKIFPFDELTGVCGRDIKRERYILSTVIRRLIKHHGIVLASVRGIGYEIIPNENRPEISQAYRTAAKNKVVKAVNVLETIDPTKLTPAELDKFLREQAKAGVLLGVCRAIETKAIRGKAGSELSLPTQGQIMTLLIKR